MTTRFWKGETAELSGHPIQIRRGGQLVSPPTGRSVLASGFPVLSGQPAVDFEEATHVKRCRNQEADRDMTDKRHHDENVLKSRKLKNAKYDFNSAETLYHRRRIMLIRR